MTTTEKKKATSQELVEQQRDLVSRLDDPKLRTELEEVLPPSVSVPTFVRALKNAALSYPDLLKADPVSLYQATLKCAMDGLLPDGRDAVILPYWDNKTKQHKAQYQAMIGGLRRVAGEFGWAIFATVVHENDQFEPDRENHKANHKSTPLGKDPGEIIGAYAIAEHRDGRKVGPLPMNVKEIERVRATSKQKDGIAWKQWWDRMAEKTVARRLFKEIPWDTKDRERIDRMLSELPDGDAAVDAMYGSAEGRPDTPPDDRAGTGGGEAAAKGASPAPVEPIPDEADDGVGKPIDEEKIEDGEWDDSGGANPPEGEQPFEGDEPPLTVEPAEPEPVEQKFEATFGSNRYEGKTVQEVFDKGDVVYLRWALKHWKTGAVVDDLRRFAELHPEIKEAS